MSGFVAASSVEQLDWDFAPYVDIKGTIPEPSEEQVDAFLAVVREVTGQGDVPDPAVQRSAEDVDADVEKKSRRLIEACATVCSEQPSYEQLMALPYRMRSAFLSWLMEKLLDPTKFSAATKL